MFRHSEFGPQGDGTHGSCRVGGVGTDAKGEIV